jgi:glycosyltransferase involved in cell wall biosynthesis
VALLGYRPHAEVLAAMSQAAVVAVPSRWQEPFGLTALEALACGAALVCSPRGGLPEIAAEAALYANPDMPAALAEAMVSLATNPAARAARAQAGFARARLFDTPAARQRLAAIRADILARWSAGAAAPISGAAA